MVEQERESLQGSSEYFHKGLNIYAVKENLRKLCEKVFCQHWVRFEIPG